MPEAVLEFQKQLDRETENDFFPTGFPSHDRTLGRLRRGSLTLIGARSSIGKTAFELAGV
jgi:replicative DNA helicase